MLTYQYTLTKDEYLDFCRYCSYNEKGAGLLFLGLMVSVPGLLFLALVWFRPVGPLWYIGAILCALVWCYIARLLFDGIMKAVAEKSLARSSAMPDFHPITLELKGHSLWVNRQLVSVENFTFAPGLLVLHCGGNTEILAPFRIFAGKEQAAEFIRRIANQ